MEEDIELSKKIKEIRNLTRLSRTKFSQLTNIPSRTLQDWELGVRKPSIYVVELLEYYIKTEIEKGNIKK